MQQQWNRLGEVGTVLLFEICNIYYLMLSFLINNSLKNMSGLSYTKDVKEKTTERHFAYKKYLYLLINLYLKIMV